MKEGGILIDAGTREVFSRPDILEEMSIGPHLLARACNDVRKEGAGCSCTADCEGTGAVRGVVGAVSGLIAHFPLQSSQCDK